MLLELQIRLTSPMLGDSSPNDYLRRFERDADPQYLKTPIREWAWTMREAGESMRLNRQIDISMAQLPVRFRKPSICPYQHTFKRNSNPSKVAVDCFESINTNTTLRFILFLPATVPSGQFRPPTRDELSNILKRTGEFIGWSPWGRKWGYGRFKVEGLNEADDAAVARFR